MLGENKDSLGSEAVSWVRFRLVSQSCLSESMECINLQTPVNLIMKITLPTNNKNNGNNITLEELSSNFAEMMTSTLHFKDLLHAANLRHGTDGFTSPPKEGMLRIFFALKNPTASARFEPANLGTKGQHATPRPPKPLRQTLLRRMKSEVMRNK